jgi:NADH dehydrogenase [ubiquinone] 1 alpha subcomplex assembly factor 6
LREQREVSESFPRSARFQLFPFRNFDRENFLSTLLYKGETRRHALAVRAFNIELSRIPAVVSDHKIALMRLQFWDDALVKMFDKNQTKLPEHPVVNELSVVIKKSKLTKRYFDRLIAARKIQNLNFISTKQMENYAEETVSSVLYLLLEILGVRNVHADHAASHLGKAQGITNILRSIHIQTTRSQYLPVPQEILMQHGVSQEKFIRSPEDKGVSDVVFDVATLAHQHLEKSLNLMSKIPKESTVCFLPAVATQRYLERLRRANFNLAEKSLTVRDNLLPLALYWKNFRGF